MNIFASFSSMKGQMMSTSKPQETVSMSQDIVITRVFDAPLALVWRAWTESEQLMKWWGPEHFTAPVCTIDFRVGGKYHYCMRSPEGQDYWNTGVFLEIVPHQRIVYTDSFADEAGNVVSAASIGMGDDFPPELTVIVTFAEVDGKTHFSLTQRGMPAGEMAEMTHAGWSQSLDKLEATLN